MSKTRKLYLKIAMYVINSTLIKIAQKLKITFFS